jgi:hypothetical protein
VLAILTAIKVFASCAGYEKCFNDVDCRDDHDPVQKSSAKHVLLHSCQHEINLGLSKFCSTGSVFDQVK